MVEMPELSHLGPMAGAVTVLVAIIGIFREDLRDLVVKRGAKWARQWIRTARRLEREEHLPELEIRVTSRFATTHAQLDTVLRLRHAFFGAKVIVPDDAYRSCWKQNRYSMKIVCYGEQPLGYWAAIPIAEETFREMLAGRRTHEELLTRHCLSWRDVPRDSVYLYVIGAVVPLTEDEEGRAQEMTQKVHAGYVIMDSYEFAAELIDKLHVRGVCGYPSRTGGYALMARTEGFRKSNLLIGNDPKQPLFVMEESDIPTFRKFLGQFIASHEDRATAWEEVDRQDFFAQFPPKAGIPSLDPPRDRTPTTT